MKFDIDIGTVLALGGGPVWLQCAERGVLGVFAGALQCEEGKARAAKEGAERCQVLSHVLVVQIGKKRLLSAISCRS